MTKTLQILKQEKNTRIKQTKEKYEVICLDHPSDDDPSKFYYLESQNKGKWYKLVATAFGTVSCSCVNQIRNPYKSCKHMKILDEIIEQYPHKIQKTKQIPSSILGIL